MSKDAQELLALAPDRLQFIKALIPAWREISIENDPMPTMCKVLDELVAEVERLRTAASTSEGRGDREATSPIGQSDVEALKHLADSMGFGRTHDMLRRVIAATPYLSPPSPDVAREAIIEECAKIAEKQPGYVSCEPQFENGYRKGREDAAKEILALTQSGQSPVPAESAPVFKATQNIAESEPSATPVCAGADTKSPVTAPGGGEDDEPKIWLLASALAGAELNYRGAYERFGHDNIETGRRWDKMRRAGNAIRAYEPAHLSPRSEVAATGVAVSRPHRETPK